MSLSADKKNIQKLQRIIVDALEDVKAVQLLVFNTEHLSPLFERVILASGNSNRQTKALAASVRDKVREAGFGKPRIEGEDNGEWIIVDCGAAVAHIMQPQIRQYYNLEEIWGDKPVRLLQAGVKPEAKAAGRSKTASASSEKTGASRAQPTRSPSTREKSGSKADGKTSTKTGAMKSAKTSAKTGTKTVAAKSRSAAGSAPRKTARPSAESKATSAVSRSGSAKTTTATRSGAAASAKRSTTSAAKPRKATPVSAVRATVPRTAQRTGAAKIPSAPRASRAKAGSRSA